MHPVSGLARGGVAGLGLFKRRSLFELRVVQQLVRVLETNDWALTSAVQEFAKLHSKKLYSSQAAEDGFNCCRRVETKSLNHRAPPGSLYSHLAQEGILRRRHDFKEVVADACSEFQASASLPVDTFEPAIEPTTDPPIQKIVGNASTPSWWTSKATTLSSPTADLVLLRSASSGECDWNDVPKHWLSCLLDIPSLIVRRKSPPLDPSFSDSWFFSLGVGLIRCGGS